MLVFGIWYAVFGTPPSIVHGRGLGLEPVQHLLLSYSYTNLQHGVILDLDVKANRNPGVSGEKCQVCN